MKSILLSIYISGFLFVMSWIAMAKLSDDIVLFMTFDEGSGTTVHDLSKYKNDGEIKGDAKWVEGKHGKGIIFDGGKTAIFVKPSDVLTKLKEPMSVGMWINPKAFPVEWQCIAEMESQPGNRTNGWKAGIHNTNPVFTTYGVKDHYAKGSLEAGKWQHLAYTYDGKTVKFYINGEEDSEDVGQGSIDVTKSPGLNIGIEGGNPGGSWYIGASLDELWISNKIKTLKEIQELMEPTSLLAVTTKEHLAATWSFIKKSD